MIIRVGFSNDTSNHPAPHKALFKLPPDMDLVPFLVVEKNLNQFTSRFSGRNESFFVVEQARSAEYLVAVETIEKDLEVMACIVPQNHNFDAEVYWHSFPFQSGKTIFLENGELMRKREKRSGKGNRPIFLKDVRPSKDRVLFFAEMAISANNRPFLQINLQFPQINWRLPVIHRQLPQIVLPSTNQMLSQPESPSHWSDKTIFN